MRNHYPGRGLGTDYAHAVLARGFGAWGRKLMLWTPPRRPAGSEDYENLWNLAVTSLDGKDEITLAVSASKIFEQIKIPTKMWSTVEFPNLAQGDEGAPVPIALGYCYGARAVCVDENTGTFRVCGHAIRRFIRIYTDEGEAGVESYDLSQAQFVLTGWDKENPKTVYVDLEGLFAPPPDLIEHVIETEAGLPNLLYKPASVLDKYAGLGFGAYGCRGDWIIGTDSRGREAVRPEISLFIREPITLKEFIETLTQSAFAFAFPEPGGKLLFRRFLPLPSDGAMKLAGADIISVEESAAIESIITRVKITYAKPVDAQGDGRVYSLASEEARHSAGLPAHVDLNLDKLAVGCERDAQVLASRMLALRSKTPRVWDVTADLKAYSLNPGGGVTLYKTRPGTNGPVTEIDGYFMLLAVELNEGGDRVKLQVTDWLGMGACGAFYVAEGQTFPPDLGGGDMTEWSPEWSEAQKRHARENGGYYSDSNEFIDPDDAETWRRSVIL